MGLPQWGHRGARSEGTRISRWRSTICRTVSRLSKVS